jgi:hypothetical protein
MSARSPGGSVTVSPEIPWSVSERENESVNGENAPATGLVVSAVKVGANPFTQPALVANESDGLAGGPESGADQGINVAIVVKTPQPSGVARAPVVPPLNCTRSFENGSCGFVVEHAGDLSSVGVQREVTRDLDHDAGRRVVDDEISGQ